MSEIRMNNIEQVLKSYYGYDEFRPLQKDIILHTIGGGDSLVLMPTGGGKSLCFQMAALMMDGMAVIVSPLISLMKDQVEGLRMNGITAEALNSSNEERYNHDIINRCLDGKVKMLYISPERLVGGVLTILQDMKVSLFAIDEAHCISGWGHDFRPEYTQLGQLKQLFPHVPIMALTATADKITKEDILGQLNIKDAKTYISSFDRPNLSLDVKRGYSAKEKLRSIEELIRRHPGESGIIYCLARKTTEALAAKLKQDGYIVCSFDTAQKRRAQIFSKYPRFFAYIIYFFDFLWHRVCPKLALTRRFYYFCTRKVRKVFPRPEILGRLYYCGFEVVSEQYIHDRYCVIGQKKREPHNEPHTYGPLIKLRRKGKGGNLFNVYKFRTMYAYSEYLQTYIYENNDLDVGGKFSDDYRVTEWGRFLRKTWLDELPMIFNILKGQMKLVGVRPLSQQYFNLYSEDLQQLRIKTKPGLLPPFYVDMPETLDEIQDSEHRYLEAYLKHPFRTDWKYFWKIVGNIVFKGKRSK